MPDLREQLRRSLAGRVCLMGLGNVDFGDDGFGVRLAEALWERCAPMRHDSRLTTHDSRLNVIVAGASPERYLRRVEEEGCDHLVFLDAVEFGGVPGAAIFLSAGEMIARFPQISTHKLSLGLLAQRVEASGTTRAWLLGVQPESLWPAERLTPVVQRTLDILRDLLRETLQAV